MTETKYWAISFGQWVELRTHPTQPKARRTRIKCPVKVVNPYTGRLKNADTILESVIFAGGKVVAVFKARTFRLKTKLPSLPNTVQRVSLELANKLLRKEGHNSGG